jgi:hypothetical protein
MNKNFSINDHIKVINPKTNEFLFDGIILEVLEETDTVKIRPTASIITYDLWPKEWIQPYIKNEREIFEDWFNRIYGKCPEGNLEELKYKLKTTVTELESRINAIKEWQLCHQTALAAWNERHGRK